MSQEIAHNYTESMQEKQQGSRPEKRIKIAIN